VERGVPEKDQKEGSQEPKLGGGEREKVTKSRNPYLNSTNRTQLKHRVPVTGARSK